MKTEQKQLIISTGADGGPCGNFWHTCLGGGVKKIWKKVLQNQPPKRQGGSPYFCSHTESYFFCNLKAHAKFWNPMITPSGRKVMQGKERREKTPFIVDT
jgi:hypothetical protein